MPWKEASTVSLRHEFVFLAMKEGTNITELCSRFMITPKTGYKWIHRFEREGLKGLQNRSRRPHSSPNKTPEHLEKVALDVRDEHPAWGGRKIRRRMLDLGYRKPPHSSTITDILRRNNRLDPNECAKHRPWKRFEQDAPNRMWQMDFKGDFPLGTRRCHPFTVLDDHSRYAVGLEACLGENRFIVQPKLTGIFKRYGLPETILVDNGAPWGGGDRRPYTTFSVWLIRLGITVIHSGAYHPQTLGKDERFHRTLKAEVIQNRVFDGLEDCQQCFDEWRYVYNFERPHEAIDMKVPADEYEPSLRSFPEELPPIEYAPGDIVRKVQSKGEISYKNKTHVISRALWGYPVALRPTSTDGLLDVFFCHEKVAEIDLRVQNHD